MQDAEDDVDVSIIIVSWNSRELLRACLISLQAATARYRREVVLVDNASSEDVVSMVRNNFPDVIVRANETNMGFAGGNNWGIRHSSGRYVFLLNPDTELRDESAIDSLVEYLDAHPEAAAVGPRLNFPDGRHQVGDAGYAPSVSAIACHALFLSRIAPRQCHGLYIVAPSLLDANKPFEVDWLCGAAMMVRRSAIESAGGLDEQLFMYAEDIEWGCRMRQRGLALHYVPAIHVMHVGGASEKLAAGGNISTRWISSLARLFLRESGGGHWLIFKASFATGFLIRAAAYTTLGYVRRSAHHRNGARRQWAYALAVTQLDRPSLMG